jgi:hypothetical protein
LVLAALAAAGCGSSGAAPGTGGDDGGPGGDDATAGDDGAAPGPEGGSSSGGDAAKEAGSGPPGAVTCSAPSTGYAKNAGSTCGTFRWAVKTGTDDDVGKVSLVPQATTVAALTALPTSAGNSCTRTATEQAAYVLKDVALRFEHLETDGDYHIVANENGHTMVVEVPYPGCAGHDSCMSQTPFLCDITHARAAVDAKNPGAQSLVDLGVGTVIGVAFFDTYELQNNPQPTGMAPNGIELHPVLAICFGQGCDPLQGY